MIIFQEISLVNFQFFQLRVSHGCVSKLLSRYNETGSYKPGANNRRQNNRQFNHDESATTEESDESKSKICTPFDWNFIFVILDNSLNDTIPLSPIVSTTRRSRSGFSPEQTQILEQFFSHTPYPDVTARENLCQHLNIEENRVHIWFSNRRARSKKLASTSSPVMNDENELPTFLTSPVMEVKPYPITEHVYDPSISMCKLHSFRFYY